MPRRLRTVSASGALLVGAALGSPLRPAIVSGESMTPTLRSGQVILCSRDGRSEELHRGDVILFRRDGEVCVKRVFALGGDRFWQTQGFTARGNVPSLLAVGMRVTAWRQRYPRFRFQQVTVPEGTVYVVGDGLSSVDSRAWGAVPSEHVLGRVVFPALDREPADREPAVWTSLPPRPARS
jgi:signal peptidase I